MTLATVLAVLVPLLPAAGEGEGPPDPWPAEAGAAAPHELHVAYGDLAVEGAVAVLRLRLFKDDLEAALARHRGEARPTPMTVDPVTEARPPARRSAAPGTRGSGPR